jgi:ATP-dependent exoDNAse (exonuclease V) beta subunit
MPDRPVRNAPDQLQRDRALEPARSCLVQAPAGSGKTTLLTERFLTLLAEVEDPGQVVAITFTRAAAAEMRHRILDELQKENPNPIAQRALQHSMALGWNLLDLPAQLRISTIDSFCSELAVQQPLISGFGGRLDLRDEPGELYRRAARRTLEQIENAPGPLSSAIELLLLARDNNWKSMEDLLVQMLAQRDRWMHNFVLTREPDWDELRARLEQPFQRATHTALTHLSQLLDQVPDSRARAFALARFACVEPGSNSPQPLAECTEIPSAPFLDDIESPLDAHSALASFLLTNSEDASKRKWRSAKGLTKTNGFPANDRGRAGKARFASLIAELAAIPGLESALASLQSLPPSRYTDEEWATVRASFVLLRHAAAQLQVVFQETASADYIEVAQIAQRVLRDEENQPTDAALAVADRIRHLLVDEFQDTSRRQHQMLASLIAVWPEPTGRSCFTVGDPMQSIYFFRGADAELFPRVAQFGIEISAAESFLLEPIPLSANFRTQPSLVTCLNLIFAEIFAVDDGSGIAFSQAEPARETQAPSAPTFELHTNFSLPRSEAAQDSPRTTQPVDSALDAQTQEIVSLIQSHLPLIEQARKRGDKYRIAILGRTRRALQPIALALHEASIPFRAVKLEPLKDRPEVRDALNLARAVLNAYDRVAWLGLLRAPWCGLSLDDLYKLAATDDPTQTDQPLPELLANRLSQLTPEGQFAAGRVLRAVESAQSLRAQQPTSAIGTWLQQLWLRLGGAACVDATARANLDLLWQFFDAQPAGDQNLLSPAFDAALDRLTALPNPDADPNHGVQLMTIHGAKGLEFEVVIVPDLQASSGGKGERRLLSWLERGLPEPDVSGDITEFLIAPLPRKGGDKGKAKAWVDRMLRQREMQEMRRLFYVATTRAREQLHLFARPASKRTRDGDLRLDIRKDSLLSTAWPALGAEVDERFAAWSEQREPAEVADLAASAGNNVIAMPAPAVPSPHKPVQLRRLSADYNPAVDSSISSPALPILGLGADRLYVRHEGGLTSRALGVAVHALFENLARLRLNLDWAACRAALASSQPSIIAQIRANGLDPAQSTALAARALQIALDATHDPICQWILLDHPEAASEVAWAGIVSGTVRTVRVDRIFQAGASPGSSGGACWWIIDYKTAHADALDPAAALPQLRTLFAPQLQAYAAVLRQLHGADARIHVGLYYPRMLQLDWWDLSAQ